MDITYIFFEGKSRDIFQNDLVESSFFLTFFQSFSFYFWNKTKFLIMIKERLVLQTIIYNKISPVEKNKISIKSLNSQKKFRKVTTWVKMP